MLSKEFFTFFTQLEKNNTKVFFDEHRAQYERFVKDAFKGLAQELIDRVRTIEPTLQLDAKDAIYRINRDIRFSSDKTPYKTHVSAHINLKGKKAMGFPGFYFEIGAKGGAVGGGAYMPEKEELAAIRDLIMHEGKSLHKLLKSKAFATCYGEIKGEKNKVLPAEFKQAAIIEPLIANKQFYYWATLPKSVFTSPDCVKTLFDYYKAAKPFNDFFAQAFD
ncbi:MAG: DUF2461 domain-containing protein [Candidatus Kapabacteria bacterium]|nr:DUF2461 domain-containing protein [Candidatus Kapabacteria bacterium]